VFGIAALLPIFLATPRAVTSASASEPPGVVGGSSDANWQAALAYVEQNFYAGVFTEPFDSRGEALILDNDPGSTYAAGIAQLAVAPEFVCGQTFTGHRLNKAGACEMFALEVISANEAVPAEALLRHLRVTSDPLALGTVLARNITIRELTGMLHGTAGSIPVDGLLLALDGDSWQSAPARRVALLLPLAKLDWQEAELLREAQQAFSMSEQPTIEQQPMLPTAPLNVSTPASNTDWCLDQYSSCLSYCQEQRDNCDGRRVWAPGVGQLVCTLVCMGVGAAGTSGGVITGAILGAECSIVCQIVGTYVDHRWSGYCERLQNACNRRCLGFLRRCLQGIELRF